jgi:hypothetical protein
MSNPLRILKTLDRHLALPAEITLFGRSALALGFPQAPGHFHNTQDVDGILPKLWNGEGSVNGIVIFLQAFAVAMQ